MIVAAVDWLAGDLIFVIDGVERLLDDVSGRSLLAGLQDARELVNSREATVGHFLLVGIDDRVYVTNVSKSTEVTTQQLSLITDPSTRISLCLEEVFGLRREESIKIKPQWADLGDRLRLKDSWTKGGKYREIPITTAEQRAVLDKAKALAGKGSLIPRSMRYKDQLNRFKAQCEKAGIRKVHGQRHRYAQKRYEALTGWKAPACGGPLPGSYRRNRRNSIGLYLCRSRKRWGMNANR